MSTFNLIFMFQRTEFAGTGDEWYGTVRAIKSHVTDSYKDLKSKIYDKVSTEMEAVKVDIRASATNVDTIQGVQKEQSE